MTQSHRQVRQLRNQMGVAQMISDRICGNCSRRHQVQILQRQLKYLYLMTRPSPPAKTGHNESKPAGSPGQNFLRWLENGINKEIVQVNTAEALIHILREGIFIVSPLIFDNYAAKHSLKREVVQKEFQRLKINLKTPQKNENVFRVRIFGKKMSMLNGWIIPLANLNVERELEVNEHLTLLKGDE